jgi:Xaa-Pro aminopeptidase
MKKYRLVVLFSLIVTVVLSLHPQEIPLAHRSGTYIVERSPLEEYRMRRHEIMDRAGAGVVLLVGRGDDRGYGDVGTFSQDNNFFYFTGLEIPDAVLLLIADERKEILFIPERNLPLESWTGPKIGPGPDAVRYSGIDDVRSVHGGETVLDSRRRPVPTWRDVLVSYLGESKRLHLILDGAGTYEHELAASLREDVPTLVVGNLYADLVEMRRKKSDEEVRLLQRAVDITLETHRHLAGVIRPGRYEYEVQAAAEYIFRKNGAEGPAFPSIIGSGFFSTVLHYDQNIKRMEAGEVVVVDIGARYGFYCGDITRTYPVSGTFTDRQRELYLIVLGAQRAVIEALRPGLSIFDLRKIAYNYINSNGNDQDGGSLGQYFIHGISHFVGLEVHDVGSEHAPLKPGDVITVEPGIYIPEEEIGIRIEDMFLVTDSGAIDLSSSLPKEPDEIERLMQSNRTNE